MAEAGWFRDPQDPGSEVYFDGQNWTSYRRPAAPAASAPPPPAPAPAPVWSAPAPEWGAPPQTAHPAAPPMQSWNAPTAQFPAPPYPPGPGQPWAMPVPMAARRRRRGRLVAVGVAAVLAAAGAVTWLAWSGSDAPQLTFSGKSIDHPADVLTTAETRLAAYVKSRHGAQNGDTHCYYVQPNTPGTSAKKTDVADHLTCGPVLFVDGDTAKPYVAVPISTDGSTGKKAKLTLPGQLTGLNPQAAPADATLKRPDGKKAPSGAGGLTVPQPPAASKDVLTTATLGPTPAPQALSGARVVGRDSGLVLEAAGSVPRYGSGDDARSAPAGQKLLAFQVDYVNGDVTGTGTAHADLVVDGGSPKPLPETAGGDEWVIAAVPQAGAAVLRLVDGGFTQTISVPEGKPGAANLAVLARNHRQALASKKVTIKAQLSNGSATGTATWHAHMSVANIDFWAPGNPVVHAPDGQHALLTTDLDYTDPDQPGHVFGFEPALLRLRLPGGRLLQPRNVAIRKNRIYNVFTVPAGFTSGTLLVTGSERVDGVTVRVPRPVSFPIFIPAG